MHETMAVQSPKAGHRVCWVQIGRASASYQIFGPGSTAKFAQKLTPFATLDKFNRQSEFAAQRECLTHRPRALNPHRDGIDLPGDRANPVYSIRVFARIQEGLDDNKHVNGQTCFAQRVAA